MFNNLLKIIELNESGRAQEPFDAVEAISHVVIIVMLLPSSAINAS